MDFQVLALECAPTVSADTLAAIVRVESGFNAYAIGINGPHSLPRQPANKREAISTAQALLAEGKNIDLGLAQINSANLKRVGLTVEDAFDACKNLKAAAQILQESYLQAHQHSKNPRSALYAALSAYNTGNFHRGMNNGYVEKVIGKKLTAERYKQQDNYVKAEIETPRSPFVYDKSGSQVMVY